MELEIGGKKYELRFGLSFINTLDKLYVQEVRGLGLGMGIEMINTYMELGRPTAVQNAIQAGTSHLKSRPSNEDIESYLEDLAMQENDDYEKLFDELKEAMDQSPFLKRAMKNLQEQ